MGSTNLRERKKIKTKRLIEDAAVALFEQQGFDRTTVSEIAQAAEIAPRTFFRYFDCKEDAAFAGAARALSVMRKCLAERDSHESEYTALRNAFLGLSRYMEEDKEMAFRRGRVIASSPTLQKRLSEETGRWSAELVSDVRTRRMTADSDLRLESVVLAMTGVFTAAYRMWVRSNASVPLLNCVLAGFAHLEDAIKGRGDGNKSHLPVSPGTSEDSEATEP
jgi:AcrR family transcriptional regulator